MLELDFVGFLALASVAFIAASVSFGLMRFLNADPIEPEMTLDPSRPMQSRTTVSSELETELTRLRATVAQVPVLLWIQTNEGVITWANDAYMTLADQLRPEKSGTWPLASVFKATSLAQPDTPGPRRQAIDISGEEKIWFDVHAFRVEGEVLYSAIPIDMTVKAEKSLRSFVQTLTSTFAHLQVGLAIFDKKRQLVLFNPALTDLTTLEPEWLSARPLLTEVLDRLRDKNMLPEPRDYKDWRDRLTTLEADANRGLFEETWALSTGQTFRIQARPHLDGGIALTIQDVSSELSLTRRFRAELELGQAVIDEIAPALAVFNDRNQLVLTSSAYNKLFAREDGDTLQDVDINETTKSWQTAFEPSPIWGDIRDMGRTNQPRTTWSDTVRSRSDGQLYLCRVVPLPCAMTLISFEQNAALSSDLDTVKQQKVVAG